MDATLVALVGNDNDSDDAESVDVALLERAGWRVERLAAAVQCRNVQVPRYKHTCNKFLAWSLVEFDVVMVVDADSVAIGDVDPVFALFEGTPDQVRFAAGMRV